MSKSKKKNLASRSGRDKLGRKTKYYRPYVPRKTKGLSNYQKFNKELAKYLREEQPNWREYGTFGQISSKLWRNLSEYDKTRLDRIVSSFDILYHNYIDVRDIAKIIAYFNENLDLSAWYSFNNSFQEILPKLNNSDTVKINDFELLKGDYSNIVEPFASSNLFQELNDIIYSYGRLTQAEKENNKSAGLHNSSDIFFQLKYVKEVEGRIVAEFEIVNLFDYMNEQKILPEKFKSVFKTPTVEEKPLPEVKAEEPKVVNVDVEKLSKENIELRAEIEKLREEGKQSEKGLRETFAQILKAFKPDLTDDYIRKVLGLR